MTPRSPNRLRTIAPPFLVAAPRGARVRTRLRVSGDDEVVLRAVGDRLGRLASLDLRRRCLAGRGDPGRRDRKRAITAESSARWAGAITRTNDDQWSLAWRNLAAEAKTLRSAISRIERRLAAPCGGRAGAVAGYHNQRERAQKQRRLGGLRARLADAEGRLQEGRLSICRGGKRLAKARHFLDQTGTSASSWQERWRAERSFVTADGEADKRLGNETIRWDPEAGTLEIRLPTALAHLANAPRARYRIEGVTFPHRGDEVAAQTVGGALRYDVFFDPDRRRWYLDASWTFARHEAPPSLPDIRAGGMLGVDLNADHLAAWVLDRNGNPLGDPLTVPLALEGLAASTRDGRIRTAISELIHVARSAGVRAIAVEDLDFAEEKTASRETHGRGNRGKRFRRTVHGLPTRRFRDRLVQMSANAGLLVVAVDPAYTSKWGGEHWQKPLQAERRKKVSRHHAAAVVIARRGLGCGARRRAGVTGPQQSHGEQGATAQAEHRARDCEGTRRDGGGRALAPAREDPRQPRATQRGTRAAKTVRDAPVEHSLVLTV